MTGRSIFSRWGGLNGGASVVAVVVVGIAVAALVSIPSPRSALLVLLGVVTLSPVIFRVAESRFDLFEPIVPIAAGLLLMYFIRAVAMLSSHVTDYRGYDTSQGLNRALLITLVGTIAIYTGYAMRSFARAFVAGVPTPVASWTPRLGLRFGTALFVLGLLLFAAYVRQLGGIGAATPFLTGRAVEETRGAASAYLYFGPFLAIPAALIFWETSKHTTSRRPKVLAVLAALEVAALTIPRGDRIWLSELLFSLVTFYYIGSGRRPGTIRVLGAALVFVVLTQVLLNTRVTTTRGNVGNVIASTATLPIKTVRDFVLGPDVSMFSVLSIEANSVPTTVPHDPGATAVSLFTGPIPNFIWGHKPQSADVKLYAKLFPQQADVTPAGTSPSMLGGFFYDSGLPGVIIGGLIVGFLVRCIWEYVAPRIRNPVVQISYSATLPLLIVFLRGNPTDLVGRGTYVVLPVLVFAWWLARRSGEQA